MSFTAADVPARVDVVINGEGYRLLDSMQPSLAFRVHRAIYGYSSTFVERQNVSGDYGDNQQAFWLTVSDRDWSLGEQQFHYRADSVGSRRYFRGTNIDVTMPGQVTMRPTTIPVSGLGVDPPWAACAVTATTIGVAATTNLYLVGLTGTATSQGAHGLGTFPTQFALADDGGATYLSSSAAASVGVRKWNHASFSTFSTTKADALAFLNNTLYGVNNTTATLNRYATDGTATTLYTWKEADGTVAAGLINPTRMIAYGGRVLFLLQGPRGIGPGQLWQYDGVGTSELAEFPADFKCWDMTRYGDVLYISGYRLKAAGATTARALVRPAIYSYVSGALSLVWQADDYLTNYQTVGAGAVAGGPGLCTFRDGCLFHDHYRDVLLYYDATTGGIHTVGPGLGLSTAANGATGTQLASVGMVALLFSNTNGDTTAPYLFPATTYPATATITTSLHDFDSSLQKYVKGVTIDADIPAGASIDIAYFTNTIPYTSTTNVQIGAVAGTEYTVGVNCRSIGFLITLNKGSSTAGPTLKRIYIRAAPILQNFRQGEYYLDLSGRDGVEMLKLRDGTTHAKDGQDMANDLFTAAQSTSPISITDRFGTFTGIIETDKMEFRETRREEYAAHVVVRQV